MNENELDNLVDMAHTIFLRMVVRGGFDSYTGARLHEWLRRYEKLPLRKAVQQSVEPTCPTCGGKLVAGKCLNLNCVALV